jgi:hypothetical protein
MNEKYIKVENEADIEFQMLNIIKNDLPTKKSN